MNSIIAPAIVLTEVICSTIVLLIHQPRRNAFFLRFIVSSIACYLSLFLWLLPAGTVITIVRYFLLYLLVFGGIYSCMKFTVIDTLYWWLAGMIIQHAVYSVTFLAGQLFSRFYFSFPFLFVLNIFTYLGEYFFIERKLRGNYAFKQNFKQTILVTIIILGTTIVLNSLKDVFSNYKDPALTIIVSVYSLICCIFAMMTLMGNFQRNRLENELIIVQQLWQNEQKQFESSNQNLEMLNMYCHDLKHLLTMMKEKNSTDEFIGEVTNALSVFDAMKTTGNHALDVILTEKSLFCKQKNIKLTCMADGKQLDFIQTTDLYSVFGNLLNNAIEATLQVQNPDKRIIALIINRSNGFVRIHIENFFNGKISYVNGFPQTNKNQPAYHGYGLKSIKYMLERYHGNISFEDQNDIFCVNIIIPIPEEI